MERPAPTPRPHVRPARRAQPAARCAGFTLIEILISIAIIAVLLALLLPALGSSIRAARGFRCQVSLRSVAFDFAVFADDQLHGYRGNDPQDVGARRFRVETFQESEYGVDEFWRWQEPLTHTLPDAEKNDPMRCPEVRGFLTLRNNAPCSQGALSPSSSVSFGFNMRLHRAEVRGPGGAPMLVPVSLNSDIMLQGRTPLAWDVDGAVAESHGVSPVFSAPTLNSIGPYQNDRYWFPAKRHNGALNVAFIDGSVQATTHPLQEVGWDWAYQPSH